VCAIPLLILMMRSIRDHYATVGRQLGHPDRRPLDRRAGDHSIVVLVEKVDAATARAVGYVRMVRPRETTAITFDKGVSAAFRRLAPGVPITTLERNGSESDSIKAYLRQRRANLPPEEFLSLVIPELLEGKNFWEIVRRPRMHRLKASLLGEAGIQVLDVPIVRSEIDPAHDEAKEPARNFVVVLVAGLHNASLQALEYAETLSPTDLRAVSFGLDPATVDTLAAEWMGHGIPIPLEIQDSPFRDIGRSLADYIKQFNPDGKDRVVTVVIPEFVVSKMRHQFLHGQTALLVKRHLLFEQGVVVASVPYQLEE
jgi:hypothetical protein